MSIGMSLWKVSKCRFWGRNGGKNVRNVEFGTGFTSVNCDFAAGRTAAPPRTRHPPVSPDRGRSQDSVIYPYYPSQTPQNVEKCRRMSIFEARMSTNVDFSKKRPKMSIDILRQAYFFSASVAGVARTKSTKNFENS